MTSAELHNYGLKLTALAEATKDESTRERAKRAARDAFALYLKVRGQEIKRGVP